MAKCCSCALWWRQFGLILLKNFVLQVRRPIGTVFELLLPVVAILLVVVLRLTTLSPDERCFSVFQSDSLTLESVNGSLKVVYFTPNTSDHIEVTSLAERIVGGATFVGVSNENELATMATQMASNSSSCGDFTGVVLPSDLNGPDLTITIRPRHEVGRRNTWNTRRTGPLFAGPGPRTSSFYFTEGFIQIQNAISRAIIQWRLNGTDAAVLLPSVSTRQLPYPKYVRDIFLSSAISLLPLLLVMSYLYSAGIFIKELVLEKETRLRESMKMMGLKSSALWCSWFVKQFLFLLITGLLVAIIMKTGQIFPNSNFLLLFLFVMVYFVSFIAFGFLLSAFFTSARLSLFIGALLWFLTFVPYLFLFSFYDLTPLIGKVALCLLSNTCVGLGMQAIATLELRGEGATFRNARLPLSNDDQFNLAIVMFMLLVDSAIYIAIGWYKEAVFPGKYGVPKPFYFLFQPSYWLGRPIRNKVNAAGNGEMELGGEDSAHEKEPTDQEVGISIRSLSKVYRTGRKRKLAVDRLNLNLYQDQITALLGHNGAGKTTTMSILTGLFAPTSGDAVINNHSILTEMDTIRQNLGLCPQHNVLFDRLTVKEHLLLFGMLKGAHGAPLRKEAQQLLVDINLMDKEKVQAGKLSGGMKRKLSVALALVGGSQFVVLDEPTSGMDPYARRATWDLLSKYKKGRTIMLSTHFMDEADLLGDRIAILVDGKLLCSGSSLFLKGRFGVGYHLNLVKGEGCDVDTVVKLILSTVDGAKKVTDVAAELSFVLPSSGTGQFPSLFHNLESSKDKLGISSYGISVTTMEEVFMKVGEGRENLGVPVDNAERRVDGLVYYHSLAQGGEEDVLEARVVFQDEPQPDGDVNGVTGVTSAGNPVDGPVEVRPSLIEESHPLSPARGDDDDEFDLRMDLATLNTGVILWLQQFRAMFTKHALNSLRHIVAIVIQLLLPTIFVLLALVLVTVTPNRLDSDPPRTLTVATSVPMSSNTKLFFADLRANASLGDYFVDLMDRLPFAANQKLNVTDDVWDIYNGVPVVAQGNVSACCDYTNQILDQFCASQTSEMLSDNCSSRASFGYHRCMECLGCCYSASRQPQTCSREGYIYNSSGLQSCPSPPRIQVGQNPSGPFDDLTTYVSEHLIRVGDVNRDAYETQYHLGFTVEDRPYFPREFCVLFNPFLPPSITAPLRTATIWRQFSTLCLADVNPPRVAQDYTAMMQQDQLPGVTVWYSNEQYHTSAAALNAYYSWYLANFSEPSNVSASPTLTVVNNPLPRSAEGEVEQSLQQFFGFNIANLVTFGISFLLASFVLFLVQERTSKAKHLQFVSGVHTSTYWMATFAWDLLNCIPPITIMIVLFAAFQVEQYRGLNLLAVFLLLILVCWSSIPFVYCFSFLFNSNLLAFLLTVAVLYFVPTLGAVVRQVVAINDANTAETLDYIFLIFPTYSFSRGIELIYSNEVISSTCLRSPLNILACEMQNLKYFNSTFDSVELPAIGAPLFILSIEGILFFLLTLLIERKFFVPDMLGRLIYRRQHSSIMQARPEEDSDVADERSRVNEGRDTDKDTVVIRNLSKVYRGELTDCYRRRNQAVDAICLGVRPKECFGLLGINGAGKTTTFNILTGDISPTAGTATIAGYDIRTSLREVQQRIGYCPQFDALLDRLTGVELLTMFARLRGIPERNIPAVVKAEVKRLDLVRDAKKRCGNYSGGNRRKLSTAIALVGSPPIVFLDEPTTGMDPTTRRHLWDALTKLVQRGKSIILTSHSMEECEALCTRLAIMVNGQFKCLGSIQHLKSKFGKGLTFAIKTRPIPPAVITSPTITNPMELAEPQLAAPVGSPIPMAGSTISMSAYVPQHVKEFVQRTFPGALLIEAHQGAATYQLPTEGMLWADVFQQIESHKEALGIEDYSVSQTTLDQVFVNFAKDQTEE